MKLSMVVVPVFLPEWDQNVSRFAFGMPVGDVGEGGKKNRLDRYGKSCTTHPQDRQMQKAGPLYLRNLGLFSLVSYSR